MKNWRYYNHAAVPTTAPHEEVDLMPIQDGSIWKMDGNPLFARWTTDFDCGYKSNWWYVIKDRTIVLEELSGHSRKHIRQGLRKCNIRVIDSQKYAEELFECYHAAFSKYINATKEKTKERFIQDCEANVSDVFWAGFDTESGKLIGYLIIRERKDYAEIITAKFNPDYLNTHVSDALYYTAINDCLTAREMKYITSGQRNIIHVTQTQDYKIKNLGYRKAYCKLHIVYNPKIKWIIKCSYPFRKMLLGLNGIGLVHQLAAVLKMEEIVRTQDE